MFGYQLKPKAFDIAHSAVSKGLYPKSCLFSSGLGLLVTWLSDPDNLNLLVVSLLDSVTPKGSVDESSGSDPERGSSSQDGEGDVEREGEGSQVWVSVIFGTLLLWPTQIEP